MCIIPPQTASDSSLDSGFRFQVQQHDSSAYLCTAVHVSGCTAVMPLQFINPEGRLKALHTQQVQRGLIKDVTHTAGKGCLLVRIHSNPLLFCTYLVLGLYEPHHKYS